MNTHSPRVSEIIYVELKFSPFLVIFLKNKFENIFGEFEILFGYFILASCGEFKNNCLKSI